MDREVMNRVVFGKFPAAPMTPAPAAWLAPWRAFICMWSRPYGQNEFWVGLGLCGWGLIGVFLHADRALTPPLWAWKASSITLGLAMMTAAVADARWLIRVGVDVAAAMLLAGIELNLVGHLGGLFRGASFNFVLIGMALTAAAKAAGRERMRRVGK